jgi:16S rRNA processing protein RimM
MKKILIGEITKGFGLKGEAKVRVFSADPEKRFKKKAILFYENDGIEMELTIESVRFHQEAVLLRFVGYPDLTSLESLIKGKLYISSDSLPKGVYVYQLKECSVYNEQDELIGPITEVIENTQLILRVKTKARDILIPYVPVFIKSVDTDSKKIIVTWMEGL